MKRKNNTTETVERILWYDTLINGTSDVLKKVLEHSLIPLKVTLIIPHPRKVLEHCSSSLLFSSQN